MRSRNAPVLALVAVLVAIMGSLVAYSPTLYQMFCDLTGYGGTVQRATTQKEVPAATDEKVTVFFDANVAPNLDWEFRPEQNEVQTRFGEPAKAYYYARNNTDETVIARASFNVTPYKAAQYFFKIECFCFTEEKLGPGESARMPLVLYVDEQLLKDENVAEVRNITLSYTFFEQSDLSKEKAQTARDLKKGSQEIDARLKRNGKVEFDNDAPRQ